MQMTLRLESKTAQVLAIGAQICQHNFSYFTAYFYKALVNN